MKTVSHFTLLLASLALGIASASAQPAESSSKQAAKKPPAKSTPAKSSSKKNEAKKKQAASKAEEKTPDVAGMHPTPYDCDLGDKLTVYKNADDDQQIALHWKKKTQQLKRMPTSTGAERFEDPESGWVWIGIPAKGMLLDSKQGRQLANECRSEEQKKLLVQK